VGVYCSGVWWVRRAPLLLLSMMSPAAVPLSSVGSAENFSTVAPTDDAAAKAARFRHPPDKHGGAGARFLHSLGDVKDEAV
jgi:hypothetical protein